MERRSAHVAFLTLFRFDARANGYARSEGVGACIMLLVDGSQKGSVLSGSAVRQDGHSASLTAPNGSAQALLLSRATTAARLSSSEVTGFQAHGTGTALGDPTEVGAIAAVRHGHGVDSSPTLGSGKANLGHSEPAAG